MLTNSLSLKSLNTFGLDYTCEKIIYAEDVYDIYQAYQSSKHDSAPLLVLGGGSNVLLTENYQGKVLKIINKGIKIFEYDENNYLLHVAAGESWHELVEFTLNNNIAGLENLALIPGTVGAAPIQNIGAYGVEFSNVCQWVEFFDLHSMTLKRLTKEQCEFGYRESVFKSSLKDKAIITQVGLKLPKKWQPITNYGVLKQLTSPLTPQKIFELVIQSRKAKLPDPSETGNAGSFFKNPFVSVDTYHQLKADFPEIIGYEMLDNKIKLAAGWLIDNAGLKGYQIGGAAVHEKQALVIINKDNAKGEDILKLAHYIRDSVYNKFNVILEVEPRVFDAYGERGL